MPRLSDLLDRYRELSKDPDKNFWEMAMTNLAIDNVCDRMQGRVDERLYPIRTPKPVKYINKKESE